MAETKYGKYIIREPLVKSMFEQIVAPQLHVSGDKDFNGANFSMGWSYITEPFLMVDEAHTHDFDQILSFLGDNPNDVKNFAAEVELALGTEKHIIDATSIVYIPKGLLHCPLNIKRVDKPFVFVDIVLNAQPSIRRKPLSE